MSAIPTSSALQSSPALDAESDPLPDLGPKWEMSGQDTILAAGGEIVAQFWTVPDPKHAELMVSAPQLAKLAELGKELAERAKGTMGPSLRYLGSDYLEAYAAVMEGGRQEDGRPNRGGTLNHGMTAEEWAKCPLNAENPDKGNCRGTI